MFNSAPNLHEVQFNDCDRLMLQQLNIRKFLAETVDQAAKSDDGEIESGTVDTVPEHWKLVNDGISLHPWQTECLERWVESGRGTVKVATGGGKTIFALAAAQEIQNRSERDLCVAIIVPTIPLMNQWLDELRGSNLPESAIGLLGGGYKAESIHHPRILICVLNSARKYLPPLIERLNLQSKLLLIVDECHRTQAKMARRVFNVNARFTLGLSATPESHAPDESVPSDEIYSESVVGKALGPVIYEFSLKDSVEAGLLTPFEVRHVGLTLNKKERVRYDALSREISDLSKPLRIGHARSRSKMSFIPWCRARAEKQDGDAARFVSLTNSRKHLLFRASARFDLTLKILDLTTRDPDRQAIVFHESVDEIERIFTQATANGLPVVLENSRLHQSTRDESIELFRRGIARGIISAKSLIEGFNVPSADIGIIAASNASVRQRIQSLGRLLRKKSSGSKAIIIVIYVKDTTDEEIYRSADWEAVIGTERNRYFEWVQEPDRVSDDFDTLFNNMQETGEPPLEYRPPCNDLNTADLKMGQEYPARPDGQSLLVDHAKNLKTETKTLVNASASQVDQVVRINRYRRAVLTRCGHLIARRDSTFRKNATWIYLGSCDQPDADSNQIVLTVKKQSGRREIARKFGRSQIFAFGPDKCSSSKAGKTRDDLLAWVTLKEVENSKTISKLYWDGKDSYWIELNGVRTRFDQPAEVLEFPEQN